MNNKPYNVSVVGLGRLGYPIAACIAAAGHVVNGVDLETRTVEMVNSGFPLLHEPGVQDLLDKSDLRLTASSEVGKAVSESDVTLIVVPTPSQADGAFSTEFVLEACQSIGASLADKEIFHLVVLVSTVMPGSTGGEVRSALETASGKRCGTDFGLCYAPSFVALGTVVQDYLNPDYLLIGESDIGSGDLLEELYRNVCENNPSVARMNFVNAELTKLATNAFVSTKITFGNMLAQFCEGLPGAHVDTVTSALGLDARIGSKYLKGGLGYGGPCLVRDSVALTTLAKRIGGNALLAEATDQSNSKEVSRLATIIGRKRLQNDVVGILGLSYKPGTDVVDSSQGVLLSQELASQGIPVVVYDPAAMNQAKRILGESVGFCSSPENCVQQSDLVVITNSWDEFKELDPKIFAPSRSRVLIDCWRILENSSVAVMTDYIPLGVGQDDM